MMHTDTLINTAAIQQFLMKDYCPLTLVRGRYWAVSHKLCCVIYLCPKMAFRVSTPVLQMCSALSFKAFWLWWSLGVITGENRPQHSLTRSFSQRGQPSWVQHKNLYNGVLKKQSLRLSAILLLFAFFTAEKCSIFFISYWQMWRHCNYFLFLIQA